MSMKHRSVWSRSAGKLPVNNPAMDWSISSHTPLKLNRSRNSPAEANATSQEGSDVTESISTHPPVTGR